VAGGEAHTCALTDLGTAKCWGSTTRNQMGDNGVTQQVTANTPVVVPGLANLTAISAKSHHTCAVTNEGKVKCWGYNPSGELGDGTNQTRRTPVDVSGL